MVVRMCDLLVEVFAQEDEIDSTAAELALILLLPIRLVGKLNPVRGVDAIDGVGAKKTTSVSRS